jgi:nucleotide-binding universal stress UspA family protein
MVCQEPGEVLARAADRPTDLLVLGCGRRGRLQRALHGSVARHCRAHARGEVLVVSPEDLLAGLEHAVRAPLAAH